MGRGKKAAAQSPAADPTPYLISCAADDAGCAGVVHSTGSLVSSLVATVETGFLGISAGGRLVRASFRDTWLMRLWFAFVTSWLARTWPFTILAALLQPLFGALPPGTEDDIREIFQRSGVESRASWTAPEEVYSVHQLTCEGNMARYKPQVVQRMTNAALKAMAPFLASGATRHQVTHVVVGSTGILTLAPGIEVELVQALGLAPEVQRLPLSPSLGDGGGARALNIGACMASGHPEAVVLVLYGDILSLQVHAGLPNPMTAADIMSTAVHGDGAAAALIVGSAVAKRFASKGGKAYAVEGMASLTNAQSDLTLTYTSNKVHRNADGKSIPSPWQSDEKIVTAAVLQSLPDILALVEKRFAKDSGRELNLPKMEALLLHPAGLKVLEALQKSLKASNRQLQDSHYVLRTRGNMSGCTVMQVLAKWMEGGSHNGPVLLLGFGQGVSLDGLVLSPMHPWAEPILWQH